MHASISHSPPLLVDDDGPQRRSRDALLQAFKLEPLYIQALASPELPTYNDPSPSHLSPRHACRHLLRLPRLCVPRTVLSLIKWAAVLALITAIAVFVTWEVQVQTMLYTRHWVAKDVPTPHSLGRCFEPEHMSSAYNLTAARAPKRTEVQAGLALRLGMDCYNFAGTVQPAGRAPHETLFHSYWRADLAPFTERQEWMLKSFFATQDLTTAKLVLWSDRNLSDNSILQKWLERFPDAFELGVVDVQKLSHGTAFEGKSPLLMSNDSKQGMDLIRFLLLWNYGGVWIDNNSLFARDFSPLLEHEFVTQWDCHDKKHSLSAMHFLKHSPYLCELMHAMSTSTPAPLLMDKGSLPYPKLWHRLVAAGIPPFKTLPSCFLDPCSCPMHNRLPGPFEPDPRTWAGGLGLRGEDSALRLALDKIFLVHLHNQWDKPFPSGGWVDRYLLSKYDRLLAT